MTPTTKQNIRSMVYCIHENNFADARKHARDVVKEKITSRYQAITQKIVKGTDK